MDNNWTLAATLTLPTAIGLNLGYGNIQDPHSLISAATISIMGFGYLGAKGKYSIPTDSKLRTLRNTVQGGLAGLLLGGTNAIVNPTISIIAGNALKTYVENQ